MNILRFFVLNHKDLNCLNDTLKKKIHTDKDTPLQTPNPSFVLPSPTDVKEKYNVLKGDVKLHMTYFWLTNELYIRKKNERFERLGLITPCLSLTEILDQKDSFRNYQRIFIQRNGVCECKSFTNDL